MKNDKATKAQDEENLRKNPENHYRCESCESMEYDMTFDEFKKHIEEVHKLEFKGLKGTKQMLMHMDGDYWFSSTYQWTLEVGLKFKQFVRMARQKHDPMRF